MPFPRKRNVLQLTDQDERKLESIRKSRTEEKRRTLRAAILVDSPSGRSGRDHRCTIMLGTVSKEILFQTFLSFNVVNFAEVGAFNVDNGNRVQ